MTNAFIHSRSYLENQTRFQTKMGKVHTRFQTGTVHALWGSAYLYHLCKGVPPPPGRCHATMFMFLSMGERRLLINIKHAKDIVQNIKLNIINLFNNDFDVFLYRRNILSIIDFQYYPYHVFLPLSDVTVVISYFSHSWPAWQAQKGRGRGR